MKASDLIHELDHWDQDSEVYYWLEGQLLPTGNLLMVDGKLVLCDKDLLLLNK